MATRDIYLVIGGSGFLGRHIVEQLLERGDNVSVFDIVQRYHDTPFYSGDISQQDQVTSALRRSGATCIIHTASPPGTLGNPALFQKVNVDGTNAVIAAAIEAGIRKLVYTSSAGVVFDGSDLINVDERLPAPLEALDAYNETKLKAEEAVLAANGQGGLLTVAIRPAGIFGPGDSQLMPGLVKVYEHGQTHYQIGDNNNLFDWTYVGNVAYAHILAADKLNTPPPAEPIGTDKIPDEPPQLTQAERELLGYSLPPIDLSIGHHRIPTSDARPLGPYVEYTPNGDKLAAAFAEDKPDFSRPVTRTRFDALSEPALALAKVHHPEKTPLSVAGQAFYITNGEPMYFWDVPRYVWHRLDAIFPGKRTKRNYFVFSKPVGLALATGSEWFAWLIGKEAALPRIKVVYSCVNRWYNIEKARRVLGYEPKVGIEEGLRRLMEWWQKEYEAGTLPKAH